MAFQTKKPSNSLGTTKSSGDGNPADDRSNKGPSVSAKTIGTIKGRYTFSKQSVTALNTGQGYYRGTSVGLKNAGSKGNMPKGEGKSESNKGSQGY